MTDPAGRALVVTASNRAAAGVYADRGGPVLVDGLRAMGFDVDGPQVVPDGEPVAAALRDAVAAGYDVVLTTGGTGLTPGDLTPEVTRGVLDRDVQRRGTDRRPRQERDGRHGAAPVAAARAAGSVAARVLHHSPRPRPSRLRPAPS